MTITSRKILMLIICTFVNLMLILLVAYIGRAVQVIHFSNGYSFPASSFQGTVQAIFSLICFLLVFIDYKKGRTIAYCLLAVLFVHNVVTMAVTHILTAIPGVMTSFVSFFTVTLLSKFYRKEAENSISDYVTGLYNRRKFVTDAENYVSAKTPFYLANLAVRDFAKVVDSYGLKAGDYVLKVIAERISRRLEKTDIVYRIAGSNFAILFYGQKNPLDIIEELVNIVKEEIVIPMQFSASGKTVASCYPILACGISKYTGMEEDYITVFNQSDLALTHARKSSSQNIIVYDEKMQQEQDNQLEAEKLILESIKNDYFYLVYQPQYEISNKKLRGFETLIRCKKPDGTIVSPVFYIPVAEKSNLILEIDDYVLKRAMTEFKPILDQLAEKVTISVNVSAKNISKENFADKIEKLISETDFPPECLEIEITEYSLAESMENTIRNIKQLRAKGVQIALDDFGTGYTSIAQLMNLPINLLKIDKSLIDDIEENQRNRDLVDSVIYMGHIMNCEVISEGVETENQLRLLHEHNCDFVQGYVWGKPMAYNDAVALSKTV